MNNPLISIIVPVYNVEQYLDRCVQSLLQQTYSPLEIILVDDGSLDNCSSLCDEYSNKYENIVVVHKRNGGLSSARNAGVAIANGNYITFVDSDDWVAKDTYEYAMGLMIENTADCVQFDFMAVSGEAEVAQKNEMTSVYLGKAILQYYLESSTRTGSYSVCRCLFDRKLVANIRFREGKINEDIDYKYKALSMCEKLVVSNQYKYFYYQSGNSISSGGLKRRDFDLYEAAQALFEMTEKEEYGKIRFLGQVKKARTAFSLLCKIAYYGISDETIEEKKLIKKLLGEHRRNVGTLLCAPIPVSRKILSVGFAVNYKITKVVISVAKCFT